MTITDSTNNKALSRFHRGFWLGFIGTLIVGTLITIALVYHGAWKAAIVEGANLATVLPVALKCRRASLAPDAALGTASLLGKASIAIMGACVYAFIVLGFATTVAANSCRQ
jgi:hypothetical protein